ncbi:MAG: hypothetical protein ACXV5Q_01475 [Frankiaceae bacterium]
MSRHTRLQVLCECAKVIVPIAAVQLTVCDNAPRLSAYVFRCPLCFTLVQRVAEPATVALLTDAGVKVVRWSMPEQEQHTGPAISLDDVIDFALGLGRADFAKELMA